MNKYQVSITFYMDEHFMRYVPKHRNYINRLINDGVIDVYSVSLEALKCWIVINADNPEQVDDILSQSTLYSYWEYETDQLFVYDSQSSRFPKMVMN
jgi:hypothetical protein